MLSFHGCGIGWISGCQISGQREQRMNETCQKSAGSGRVRPVVQVYSPPCFLISTPKMSDWECTSYSHCPGCWIGFGPQLPPLKSIRDGHSFLALAHHQNPPWWVFLLPHSHPLGCQSSLWISLLLIFSGKDNGFSGLRDTVWSSKFSS